MNNQAIILKLKQRLGKLDSFDYENIDTWMYVEAFNKAQIQWIRRQLEGINQERAGAESTTRRIDDLQFILKTSPLVMTNNNNLYWSGSLPADYLQFNRVSTFGKNECCPARRITVFESIEADRDINLHDSGKQPTFEWATTFCTVSGKQINIYTNGKFDLQDTTLTYYRTPVDIQVTGVVNISTGTPAGVDVLCEAADNIVELIIEEAVTILSMDIQDYQRAQLAASLTEKNT